MIQTNQDQLDYDYAFRAYQDPRVRESDEFREWLSEPANRQLFRDVMACHEAVARNCAARMQHRTLRRRIWSGAAAVAAVALLLWGVTVLWTLQEDTSLNPASGEVFFAAVSGEEHEVTLQSESGEKTVLKEQEMDVRQQETSADDPVEMQTVSVPRGKDFRLTLADGTEVWLNAGSTLRYPSRFTKQERLVELQGEAYFRVAKDKEHPFVVKSGEAVTQVLGTQFNFRAYRDEETHVTLVSGSVKVTGRQGRSAVLRPGQDLSYTPDGQEQVREVNTECYTAWTEGFFYFEEAPLEEIMRTLGRWYNVSVRFDTPAVSKLHFNFWAERHASLEETVELINRLGKVKLSVEGTLVRVE